MNKILRFFFRVPLSKNRKIFYWILFLFFFFFGISVTIWPLLNPQVLKQPTIVIVILNILWLYYAIYLIINRFVRKRNSNVGQSKWNDNNQHTHLL